VCQSWGSAHCAANVKLDFFAPGILMERLHSRTAKRKRPQNMKFFLKRPNPFVGWARAKIQFDVPRRSLSVNTTGENVHVQNPAGWSRIE
jgi:hypothetical protein